MRGGVARSFGFGMALGRASVEREIADAIQQFVVHGFFGAGSRAVLMGAVGLRWIEDEHVLEAGAQGPARCEQSLIVGHPAKGAGRGDSALEIQGIAVPFGFVFKDGRGEANAHLKASNALGCGMKSVERAAMAQLGIFCDAQAGKFGVRRPDGLKRFAILRRASIEQRKFIAVGLNQHAPLNGEAAQGCKQMFHQIETKASARIAHTHGPIGADHMQF